MKISPIALAMLSALALGGCSSGSDSSPEKPVEPVEPVTEIQGVASQGGGIVGWLEVAQTTLVKATSQSARQAAPAKPEAPSQVRQAGQFTLEHVDQMSLPALLKIVGSNGGEQTEQYSLILDNEALSERVNLSPLTRLLISRITGVDAAKVYANLDDYRDQLTQPRLDSAQEELRAVIRPLLDAAGLAEGVDLLTSEYQADYTGLDAVLSTLEVEYTEDKAVLTYRPAASYRVELPYDSDWGNKALLPDNIEADKAKQDLQVISEANRILEAMILLNQDADAFNAYLHPQAHWFGNAHDELASSYFDGAPSESSTMDRYRDFRISASDGERGAYLISYTERFESSKFASSGRRQAWFAVDPSDDKLKFLGDYTPMPTSATAFYKANHMPAEYAWNGEEQFSWVLEVDAFPAISDCTAELNRGEWSWSPDYIDGLSDTSAAFGFEYLKVEGPGIQTAYLNKVYRDVEGGNCHLVDGQQKLSPMLSGLTLNLEDPALVDGAQYRLTFVFGDGSKDVVKTVTLGKAPESKQVMLDNYMAQLVSISGKQDELHYEWTRGNPFVIESDLWVYYVDHQGLGDRIAIEDGKTRVEKADARGNAEQIFHAAFDPYGRVLSDGYVKGWNDPYLQMK